MTVAQTGGTSTPTRSNVSKTPVHSEGLAHAIGVVTDLLGARSLPGLRSSGWTHDDGQRLVAHLGRGMLQGCSGRDFKAAWIKDPATGQNRPRLHRVGTKALARCQYVALTHPQRSAVLVIDVDKPSGAGGGLEHLDVHVHHALTQLSARGAGPSWIGINPQSGKCQLLWMIDPVYAGHETTSPNTRLLTVATDELNALLGGDAAFSHRLSRWPLHISGDPTAYRWHCQHHRVDRLADLVEEARMMTGRTRPDQREPEEQFSSGWARIEAARQATAAARALAELDADLPEADEAASDLIDGVRVLWSAPGRAARDETAFRHALTTGHRLRAAGERLKDAKIIDAYERAYNVAQAVGADHREPDLPSMGDRQTMARRVRGYVTAATSSTATPATRSGQTSRGRKALATMGRRGGQKAAERWKTDDEYADRQREKLQQTHRRNRIEGQTNRARVQAVAGQYYVELNRMPSWRELMDETGLSRRSVARHLAALRDAGMLPESGSN